MNSSINVDPIEIDKFAAHANEWWDKEGPLKTLHHINPWRLAWINSRCPLAGISVLDVGCGGGLLAEAMAQAGATVTGIDLEANSINIAKAHAEQQGLAIDYQIDSIEDFTSIHPHQFDCVTCLELLEHVPDPSSIIAACATALKPGGPAFFSTINRTPLAYATAIVGAEYLLNLLPQGTHDYEKFIKPSELANYLRNSGLKLSEMQGMSYNPITHAVSSSSHLQINYIVYCQS